MVLRKHAPDSDGFFDLDPAYDNRVQQTIARAAVAARRGQRTAHEIALAVARHDDPGILAVPARDARAMNAAVEMPSQPNYDWAGVLEDDE